MTAPTPSPEEFAKEIAGAFGVYWLDTPGEWEDALRPVLPIIALRDAALLAPLREENARLRAEATAHMGVARAAEAEVAKLREALRYTVGVIRSSMAYDIVPAPDMRRFAAARALAEGQP